ncbi:ABC transporter substrate-binding protein [Salinibacterium sp. NG253]|uniref:ABC transporter substrate-binding protein n=1 Tax=Salinibacterium sp. NG253 TaxID=2792039 RepID=UPI0018CD91EE|nr:ABC transporter substrate-binding protein [Salinibacterium sp. NG253]MBH0116783.1 ABC transporter substrate-binding protein [Salinibacterium sp. NG253]
MAHSQRRGKTVAKAFAIVTAIALTASACSGGGSGSGSDEDTLTIGSLFPQTGALASLGTEMFQGTEIARQMINDDGGIHDKMVEWEKIDASDADASRQGAERLVNLDIDIAVGSYGSAIALASAPVISRAGGVLVEVAAQSMEVTNQGFAGIYRVNGHAAGQGATAVAVAVEVVAEQLGVDPKSLSIGFAGLDSSYGNDIAAGIEAALEAEGLPPLAFSTSYAGDTTDFAPIALTIKDAAPDILMAASYPVDAVALGRAMKASGFQPEAVIGTGGAHNDLPWLEAMGNDANGVFSIGPTASVNENALSEETREKAAEFYERYEAEYGHAAGAHAVMGFDGVWTAFQILREADEPTAAAFIAAASTFELPEGSLLNSDGVKFDETGQNEMFSYSVNQWQDGEAYVVFPEENAFAEPALVPLPGWGEQ